MNVDKCHKALLNLAEEFRTKSPPDLKSCMQCLLAILNLPVPLHIIARTNYHLGSLIHKYTLDTTIAQSYLERAYEQTQSTESIIIRLQVVALLVDIYMSQNQRQIAKQILTRAINDTTTSGGGHLNLYWHYRFLLKLSHLNLEDGDFTTTTNLLSIGAQTASATNDIFTRILFLLSKGMVLMIAKKIPTTNVQQQANLEQQLVEASQTAANLIEALQGDSPRNEALKVFYLVLQVCSQLNKGHNKSAKTCLKLLQQSIQNLTNVGGPDGLVIEEASFISPNMSENFAWLPKDIMCVLVYVISVLHSMQAGFLDKAQKYTEKAFMQIERLRTQSPEPNHFLKNYHVILLEHMSMCNLVMGSRSSAIKQTVQAIQLCSRGSLKYRQKHRPILNTLLGFYAMSMSMMDNAEIQFTRVLNDENAAIEMRVMAMLNLALCYLQDDATRHQRRADVEELLSRFSIEQMNSLSYCLRAAAYYVFGLKAFCEERTNDAKRNLRETLTMSNGEDLNRLTSCSLVLLGKIFNNSELPRESLNMVTPAMKLAGKIPDIYVQLWASSVLKDIYSRDMSSQYYRDANEMHASFKNRLDQDRVQTAAIQEHGHIGWTDF